MLKIGFLINPIAGMGGRVGLKGTDGVYEEALRRGAEPVTPARARNFLESIGQMYSDVVFLVPCGDMGENIVSKSPVRYEVVYQPSKVTGSDDTKHACLKFIEKGAELILFVGGDGTARDVASVVRQRVPILGIPSGVKMYSSVFCLTPKKCATVLKKFLSGEAKIRDAEVLDIDENSYRQNVLNIKLYNIARVPYYENLVQCSKSEYGTADEEEKEAIAEFFVENMDDETLYILGAGTTTAAIARKLGVEKTLLGVDAYFRRKIVGRDLNEEGILQLLDTYRKAKIVLTPIGSQGFVFGRGNQQISSRVLEKIGLNNIIIIATPTKLQDIDSLHADLEEAKLQKYFKVLTGYGKYRMVKMD